jgi:predicted ATPase
VLLRAEVLRELRRDLEREYIFKHGLMQEAALSTLTRRRRIELHARVASAYEGLYPASLDDHLERLAHHHAQSENLPRALEYLEAAAGKAASLDASTRASELWERAHRVAERLGDEDAEARIAGRLEALPHN